MALSAAGPIPADAVLKGLREARIDFVASLVQDDICEILRLLDREEGIMHIHLTREEEGFGICAGAYFAGKNPAIIMHNTGLLACSNAIYSLSIAHEIPVLLLVSYSGYFGEQNSWIAHPGLATESALNALGVKYWILREPGEVSAILKAAHQLMHASKRPVAVLLPPKS
jgi:sulfopyruvate decarboxylase subunit alpha